MPARAKGSAYQGMNWCAPTTRLAIYLRDGLACCYCGASLEDGAALTLDHLKPYSKGGSHHYSNLITACRTCNSSRGTRAVTTFARSVAAYRNTGLTTKAIVAHIRRQVRRDLASFRLEARTLISRRGSVRSALDAHITN